MPGGWAPPQRRKGEGRGSARKRWKATGRCRKCGRKLKGKGRVCGACVAKGNKRYGPKDRDR